jgi:hypothetical protein
LDKDRNGMLSAEELAKQAKSLIIKLMNVLLNKNRLTFLSLAILHNISVKLTFIVL